MLQQKVDYSKYIPRKLKNQDGFIDPSKSRTYFVFGNRGSGKSSVDEVIAEIDYDNGHVIMDIHSASNYESLYWCMCLDCKKQWDSWREINNRKPVEQREEEPLHCNCFKRYPILLVVPDYIEFDQEALDIFNEKYISREKWIASGGDPENFRIKKRTVEEDKKGEKITRISSEPRIDPDYKEWIKIHRLHVPNKGFKNRDVFVSELTHGLLTAQKERRIFVINPKFYRNISHKLVVLEKIIREIPDIISSVFVPLSPQKVGEMRGINKSVSYGDMTPRERNYHRVTILMREFGSLVSQQLNEEKNQVIIKKAIFGIIKVIRQFSISGCFDAQRYADLYSGVRDQRDVLIFRRSNIDIFPKEYEWLRKELAEVKEAKIKEIGIETANLLYPNFEDLANDQMFVLFPEKTPSGKRYKIFKVGMPNFHHHQEDDHFEQMTGIKKDNAVETGTWRFIDKTADGTLVDSAKDVQNEDKKLQEAKTQQVFEIIMKMKNPLDGTKKSKDQEIFDHLKTVNMLPDSWKGVTNLRVFITRTKKRIAKARQT